MNENNNKLFTFSAGLGAVNEANPPNADLIGSFSSVFSNFLVSSLLAGDGDKGLLPKLNEAVGAVNPANAAKVLSSVLGFSDSVLVSVLDSTFSRSSSAFFWSLGASTSSSATRFFFSRPSSSFVIFPNKIGVGVGLKLRVLEPNSKLVDVSVALGAVKDVVGEGVGERAVDVVGEVRVALVEG